MTAGSDTTGAPSHSPTIAVVTVCLNDLGGLRSTYESLRSQTLLPHQWIVADGASTDGTQQWLDSLHWPLLRWSSSRDGGIYQGMNKGLAEATADYVLFLNSGDVLCDPKVLESVAAFLAARPTPPTLLYGDNYEVDNLGRDFLHRARPVWWVWLGMPTTHQSMYFRRESLTRGFDTRYRLAGDYEAVARLYIARRGSDFAHLPRPLCCFHLGGRTDQNRNNSMNESHEIRRRVLGMSGLAAYTLHAAHHVHGWIKKYLPAVHRAIRYG